MCYIYVFQELKFLGRKMSWGQAGGWKLPRGPESKNFQGLGANFSGLNVRGGGGVVRTKLVVFVAAIKASFKGLIAKGAFWRKYRIDDRLMSGDSTLGGFECRLPNKNRFVA